MSELTRWEYATVPLLTHATNLMNRDTIIDYLDRIHKSKTIKVVILMSSSAKTGAREYEKFFKTEKSGRERNDICRMCNVFGQLIHSIVESNKIFINVYRGDIISLFLNIGFACDYRIMAGDAVFFNAYLDLGLTPIGGGAYFLSKLLGCTAIFLSLW